MALLLGARELVDVIEPVNDVEQAKGEREEESGPPVYLRDMVRVKEPERKPFIEGAPRAWWVTVLRL